MCNRVMIINWKFRGWIDSKKTDEYLAVTDNEGNVIAKLHAFKYYDPNVKEFRKIISSILADDKSHYLLFLHKENQIKASDLNAIELPINYHVIEFEGGNYEYKVLYDELLQSNGIKQDSLNERFNKVWDKYYNYSIRKKIDSLLLPLAIDIQGLYEVKESDEACVSDYYDKIKTSCKLYDFGSLENIVIHAEGSDSPKDIADSLKISTLEEFFGKQPNRPDFKLWWD